MSLEQKDFKASMMVYDEVDVGEFKWIMELEGWRDL